MNSRNVNQHHHRRGHSFNGFANVPLLSNTNSSHGKLGRPSLQSAKLASSRTDYLFSSTEGGEHDYDWLLTPPGTPHLPSKSESQPTLGPQRSSLGRPTTNTNASRDVRNSSGSIRSAPSATLYPQSIRSSTPKTQHSRGFSVPTSTLQSRNNGKGSNRKNGGEIGGRQRQYLNEVVDVYESYGYDSVLLKEDLNNTNWLRSVDDKCDQRPIFDNGFESLPEPFGLF